MSAASVNHAMEIPTPAMLFWKTTEKFDFRRVPYDRQTTAKKIYDTPDLDNFLGDRLGEGR